MVTLYIPRATDRNPRRSRRYIVVQEITRAKTADCRQKQTAASQPVSAVINVFSASTV